MLNVLLQPYFKPKAIVRRYFLMLHAALQNPHEIKLDKTLLLDSTQCIPKERRVPK